MDPLVDQALSVLDKAGTLGALVIAIIAYNMEWIVPGRQHKKLEKRADKQDATIEEMNKTMRVQGATTDRAMTTVRETRTTPSDALVSLTPEESAYVREIAREIVRERGGR